MATTKSFSYHQQVARLQRAEELIRQAQDEITACADHEREHHQEEGAEEYDGLLVNVEDARHSVAGMLDAVKALAVNCPPDLVEPRDPQDFSEDPRFQRMIDDAHDMTAQYALDPTDVGKALAVAVSEGDQR